MLVSLQGRTVRVGIDNSLRLTVSARDGEPLWESSRSLPPAVRVAVGGGGSHTIGLADARERSVRPYACGRHAGYRILLTGYADADVTLALTVALDADDDELLIGIEQAGGEHAVQRVDHLYRFERPVAQGGHLVLPHGSGYLVPADCPDALPGRGPEPIQVGGRWSLPMFGLTRDDAGLCATVDTWWDAEVRAHHLPGDRSILDFSWADELGTLAYPRRLLVHFARDLDYVAMAKRYRAVARQQGLLRTLEEKADDSPRIRAYADNVLFRWTEWNGADSERVLGDLRRLRELGIGANLFYPKWGGSQGRPPIQNHQAFLVDDPGDGGWTPLVDFADRARELGCVTQGFIRPCEQSPGVTGYDESYWAVGPDGARSDHLSTHAALEITSAALDGLQERGLRFDVLYFDGYAAANIPPRSFSSAHPVTRRQVFEAQNACFDETRRRGIIPAGELRQFWAIPHCDHFFFTDWSGHRLSALVDDEETEHRPVGEPIPLCQLVFHDCCMSGFSGDPGQGAFYDWFPSRPHRLYELLYGAPPAYNWILSPRDGYPVPVGDWQSDRTARAIEWLRTWSAFYRSIAMSEMTGHRLLSPDGALQRTEFACGIAAEFDLPGERYRILGSPDFDGTWQTPVSP
jgi:hypothetical protein